MLIFFCDKPGMKKTLCNRRFKRKKMLQTIEIDGYM